MQNFTFGSMSTGINYAGISTFNHAYGEEKRWWNNLGEINRQRDITNRQWAISQTPPGDLEFVNFFLRKYSNPNIDAVVSWMAEDSCVDPTGVELALLACINSTVRGKLFVRVNQDWRESSVLHVINFAPSGYKKSLVVSKLLAPIQKYEEALSDTCIPRGKLANIVVNTARRIKAKQYADEIDFDNPESIASTLKKAWEDERKISGNMLDSKRLLISANTSFGLMTQLHDFNQSGLILNAESSDFEKFLFGQSLELLIKTYGQEPYQYHTNKCSIILSHPALCLSLFAQEDIAIKIFQSSKLNERGVTARMIPTLSSSRIPNKSFHLTGDEAEIYERKMLELLDVFGNFEKVHQVELDSQAQIGLSNVSQTVASMNIDDPSLSTWRAKLTGNILRCALAYHIWNDPKNATNTKISLSELQSAIEIMECACVSARFLYHPLGLRAHYDAHRIIKSYGRIQNQAEQQNFIRQGTDSTKIQQRIRMDRIRVNNALQVLAWKNFFACYDDGSGKFVVLPRYDFYRINMC